MPDFATYLHPQTCHTSKPAEHITFVGHSYPHFSRIRAELEKVLAGYPRLPLRKAEYSDYLTVHKKSYLDKLTLMAAGKHINEYPRLSIECQGFEYCLPGYLYGLGGMLEAIDHMHKGTLKRAYCFSLGGHHAYADWGHGYCLLNPQAASTRYAQIRGFKKVLIVDWDIHHGDGTQSLFTGNPDVYCISIHSGIDMYMSFMRVIRQGTTVAGKEAGHCNIPLLDESFGNELAEKMGLHGIFYRADESLEIFQSSLEQIPWTPDMILIFSGYDSHKDDCGKGITNWTDEAYRILTRCVIEISKNANCPVLSVHGGGYILPVTINAALSHVEILQSV